MDGGRTRRREEVRKGGARSIRARRDRARLPVGRARARSRGLALIAVFKLVKGLILLAAGIAALKLLHSDLAEVLKRWANLLGVDPDNRYIHRVMSRVFSVNHQKLREISAGSFFYSALLLTEGVGLWLEKRWAEYFTLFVTGSFIPLELYELLKRLTWAKLFLIAINVFVVGYLAARVRPKRSRPGR
jgi:uncharacterized membrane protein (DUF2068 family)